MKRPLKRKKAPPSKNTLKNSNADVVEAGTSGERDRFLSAIGTMIVSFAHFEGSLVGIVANLTTGIFDDEELTVRVVALVTGQPFNQLLARLSAQLQIAARDRPDFRKRTQNWITAAERAYSTRSRFAHNPLVFRPAQASNDEIEWALYKARASKRAGFTADFAATKVEAVFDLQKEIDRLASELQRLLVDMIKAGVLPITVRYRLVRVDPAAPPEWESP